MPSHLSQRLRIARLKSGFTQEDVASWFGLTRNAISLWESQDLKKRTNPSTDQMKEFAKRTGVPLGDYLLNDDVDATAVLNPLQPIRIAAQPVYEAEGFSIPVLNVVGSMGGGVQAPDHLDVVRRIVVDLAHLSRKVGFTAKGNLQFITGYGDSMEPTYSDGDVLLVDTGVFEINMDAVYVMEKDDGELYIKRMQRRPDGNFMMISDNKEKYLPFEIKREDISKYRVRGRVILAWNAVPM